jgi:hypothetical protein
MKPTLDAEDHEIIKAWAEEAERRDEEMTRTSNPGIPADEVFERLVRLALPVPRSS